MSRNNGTDVFYLSALVTFLPDGLHTVAEVIEDMATLYAAASREEIADDTGDVLLFECKVTNNPGYHEIGEY